MGNLHVCQSVWLLSKRVCGVFSLVFILTSCLETRTLIADNERWLFFYGPVLRNNTMTLPRFSAFPFPLFYHSLWRERTLPSGFVPIVALLLVRSWISGERARDLPSFSGSCCFSWDFLVLDFYWSRSWKCFGFDLVSDRRERDKMSFIGTQQKCKACEKTVYPMDQLMADGIAYHKSCFKCSHCKGTLKASVCFPFSDYFDCFPFLRYTKNSKRKKKKCGKKCGNLFLSGWRLCL